MGRTIFNNGAVWALALFGGTLALTTPAHAELVLDKVVLDLEADRPARGDIEVLNEGEERMYVLVEPFEVVDAGLASEHRQEVGVPSQSKMLVTPSKLVLEPGERRTVRIAALGDRPASDRIFRVRIRPVVGEVQSDQDALKLLVGYDALVLVRAAQVSGAVEPDRKPGLLRLVNKSNTAYEYFSGRQCDAAGEQCVDLPATRLYPGATFDIPLTYTTKVTFNTAAGAKVGEVTY